MRRCHSLMLACAMVLATRSAPAVSVTVWSEDFSNVNDWRIISDPGGGSTITSDGSRGLLYVDKPAEQAAYGPKVDGASPFVVFDPDLKSAFSIHFTVDSLSYSVSYDVSLDLFGATSNWIATLWQVFPPTDTSTFVGYTNVNLGGFSFDASTVYLMPKITVHTGEGAQTVYFDEMHFEQEIIPEPATAAVFAIGVLGLFLHRRRHTNRP